MALNLYQRAFLLTKGRVVCGKCYKKAPDREKTGHYKLLWYPEALLEKCDCCKQDLIRK